MPRCFLALAPSEQTRHNLAKVQEQRPALSSNPERSLKVTKPSNLHLTLKFFGSPDDRRRTELLDATQILADTTTALPELELGGLGVFPDLSRPRSIHARVARGERDNRV